jgi:hypothetical protein
LEYIIKAFAALNISFGKLPSHKMDYIAKLDNAFVASVIKVQITPVHLYGCSFAWQKLLDMVHGN